MLRKDFIKKYLIYIRTQGILSFASSVLAAFYFHFYRFRFKSCGKIFCMRPYKITGFDRISIGRFSAGPGLRIDAIKYFQDQRFNPNIEIGHNVSANCSLHIACSNSIRIGNNVLFASNIYLSDHDHGYYDDQHLDRHQSPDVPPAQRLLTDDSFVVIEDNVWIGEFVSILKGVTIGRGSIVGSNSVVTKDIPPDSIAVGSPARVIKKFDHESGTWKPFRRD